MTVDAPLCIETARPAAFPLPAGRTALIIIDMQRDFVQEKGYGEIQCPSAEVFAQVSGLIKPCLDSLRAARKLGMTIVHTREGHVEDLSDCPPTKTDRQRGANKRHFLTIGEEGPMGRLLVRGAYGHDIVDDLTPRKDEVILDKPGKGSFFNTDLHEILVARGVTHIFFCGVTAECCVASTFREANDHGFECCVLADCIGGFNDLIVTATKDMFCAYDGLLGYSTTSKDLVAAAQKADTGLLGVIEPFCANNSYAVQTLHSKYVAGTQTVTSMVNSIIQSATDGVELSDKEQLLKTALVLDDDSSVDIDGVRNLAALYGVPFYTTSEFSPTALIIEQMKSQGALYMGTTTSPKDALSVGSFVLTTVITPSSSPEQFVSAFTTTKNSLSTSGITLSSPTASTITILAHSILDARILWSTLVRLPVASDTEAALIQHYRERPIIYVDYRGAENAGVRYAVYSSSDVPESFQDTVDKLFTSASRLKGRKVPAEVVSSTFASAAKLAACAESVITLEKASPTTTTTSAMDTIKNMHALSLTTALFNKAFDSGIESPDMLVAPLSDEVTTAIEALGACAAVVKNGIVFVAAKGYDARVFDAGVVVQM
ncbi:Isochorismatase-like protein [Lipomyces oligophaga]|uniref:Isochorismatase-like protein n=1 Tax=Lipomyces oligophaga TaxID=45792 RepID=UPI0034CE3E3D